MVYVKYILASLSVKEKVELFKRLYEEVAGMGINGDTELAHINKHEGAILKMMGGAGTINEATGLIQYFGGSPPPPPAASSTVTQQATIPDEIKPYITDVLTQSQALNKQRTEEGYQPYQGAQIADFQPEQTQAQTGIAGLVGSGQPYFDKAEALTQQAGQAPTAEAMQSYMSPYMQNVVDIQKREALRQGDVAAQAQAAGAVNVGAYGGSRDAIVQAEQQRNLATQLGDIQAKGSAAAYADAQQQYAAQQKNALAAGQQYGQLATAVPGQAMKEFGALESVGAAKQQQEQQALNLAKQQFIQEQTFPEANLQQYSSIIRGYNLPPNTYQTAQTTTPAPSYMQQIAGLGMAGAGIAGAFGGFGKKEGGLVGLAKGGKVLRRADGGQPQEATDLSLKTDDELRKLLATSELPMPAVQEELSKRPSAAPLKGTTLIERINNSVRNASGLGRDVSKVGDVVGSGLSGAYDYVIKRPVKYITGYPQDTEQAPAAPTKQPAPEVPAVPAALAPPAPAKESVVEEKAPPAKTLSPRAVVDTSKWDDMLSNVGKTDDASTTELNNLRTDLALKLDEASEKKKGILGKRQEELGKQKWMALAEMGASVLAQPGGQTFLQSMGRGVKESGIIGTLAKIGDKASDIETDLAEMDTKTMMAKYGLKKDQIADIKENKKLDIERMKAVADAKFKDQMIGVYDDRNEATLLNQQIKTEAATKEQEWRRLNAEGTQAVNRGKLFDSAYTKAQEHFEKNQPKKEDLEIWLKQTDPQSGTYKAMLEQLVTLQRKTTKRNTGGLIKPKGTAGEALQ
ncbi:hypothetical protein UFOVP1292_3 [uncultured Caudovirales phage]|uniref:Uncharacterized protein n=1 Tax=uncultured Caudovirales phage TaxID=2100421 RepID=A0A6J5RHF7_9CAUD|nr:hypothetical protein UFOVP859_9 [uncultured Caudovirales phage]CAB4168424.1 hypothetical protein UFOVP882_4 [uncultured Caudovirales phage]CAB4196399.1 hypothetical protein UFOVP1292_3 [uncultured Caudovirales phage]CAB4205368.1 hypothetical protein UFOVP1411_77 [uncultured Caudovirales phage]